ncbi:hypothetical protein [Fodinibius saliphilus]|uniref:hypothetical protein n=1 Tax=Fodinibius saliphilus TaxID=1920650 RepID=UPI0011094143|nr:hypothetical protein [Fodinibius saliphilus]
MQKEEKFSAFGQTVEELEVLSQKLIQTIDNQTKAVIASNDKKIEEFAERYTTLKGSFKEQEKQFIDQLQDMTPPKDERLKLEHLKETYPQYGQMIEQWEESLGTHTRLLKRKHKKLNELLEFALNRNVELMHSIYRLHNQKNTHYSSGGGREEIASGMAVNKEA